MLENLTDRARKAMQLANQEAQHMNQEAIGPEHVLLGLIKEGTTFAARALDTLNVTLKTLRAPVMTAKPAKQDAVTMGKLPFDDLAKQICTRADIEAQTAQKPFVDTKHILLAIFAIEGNGALRILLEMGVTREKVIDAMAGQEAASQKALDDSSVFPERANLTGSHWGARSEAAPPEAPPVPPSHLLAPAPAPPLAPAPNPSPAFQQMELGPGMCALVVQKGRDATEELCAFLRKLHADGKRISVMQVAWKEHGEADAPPPQPPKPAQPKRRGRGRPKKGERPKE